MSSLLKKPKGLKMGFLSIFLCLCNIGVAQESRETLKEELRFKTNSGDNFLVVQNVNGSIDIEGYQGNTILVEVEKTVKAKNQGNLDLGKREISLKVEEKENKIFVYLDSPWTYFDLDKERFKHRENYDGHYHRKYRYNMDFKIKVPQNTNIKLGTMNNGDIYVQDVFAKEVIVSNLNGAITMENITGKTDVNALNKDINITYRENPKGDSYYNSLNGDIDITFKEGLNADVSFKSLNGDFYTNYDTTQLQPEVTKKKVSRAKGIKYKVSSNESFRIGQGGIKLDFNLLNGDATVKK